MKPAPFAYHRATTVAEAADMLASTHGKVLAGGQSLIPMLSMRLASPPDLVDINAVTGLDTIEVTSSVVRIGSLVRHRQLERHEAAYAANPLLRQAVSHVAHATIRNRGTTVGSLVHADPAAEMPGVLALLGGSVEVTSSARGPRSIPAADFFVGPLESSIGDDELAVSATFPNAPERTGSSWLEVTRRHGDYALVGVGALVTLDEDQRVAAASVVLISVGGVPVVVDVSEAATRVAPVDVGSSAGAAIAPGQAADWAGVDELVLAAIEPEADIHATAQYRARLATVLSRRALVQATCAAAEQVAGRVAAAGVVGDSGVAGQAGDSGAAGVAG